jgi:hypothetical protein
MPGAARPERLEFGSSLKLRFITDALARTIPHERVGFSFAILHSEESALSFAQQAGNRGDYSVSVQRTEALGLRSQ